MSSSSIRAVTEAIQPFVERILDEIIPNGQMSSAEKAQMANVVGGQLTGDLTEDQIRASCQQSDIGPGLLDWLISPAYAATSAEPCIVTGKSGIQYVIPHNRGEDCITAANAARRDPQIMEKLAANDGTPGNNRAQNKQVDDVVRLLRLNKDERRLLHMEISGQNFDSKKFCRLEKKSRGGSAVSGINIVPPFQPLIGQYVWNVRRTHGSCLLMEFGNPKLNVREPRHSSDSSQRVRQLMARRRVTPVGTWSLLILQTDWEIHAESGVIDQDAPPRLMRGILAQIDGQILLSARVIDTALVLEFDLGGRLALKKSSDPDAFDEDEQWSLSFPDGRYVSFTNGGQLKEE